MQEKALKLQELFKNDQSFAEKLFSLENREEVQDFLKTKGIEFTLDEIDTIKEAIIKNAPAENGELSDEALENVAGGDAWDDIGYGIVVAAAAVGNFFRRW